MIRLQNNPRLHVFTVEAMNTTFTLRIDHPDGERAKDAASDCIKRLEELEGLLSRFRPDSDISRINQLKKGESLLISEDVHACLLKAAAVTRMTAGLFDPTVGAYTWPDRREAGGVRAGRFEVAPGRPKVQCAAPGARLDLGGIGKGFALDQLAVILASYQFGSALLCAGASTMLAVGPDVWPVELTGGSGIKKITLSGRALSASGIGVQGAHVVHPDEPDEEPAYLFERVWVLAPDAAAADALSTACLLMDDLEIEMFADQYRGEVEIYTDDIDGAGIERQG